jgi:hypothetical protein
MGHPGLFFIEESLFPPFAAFTEIMQETELRAAKDGAPGFYLRVTVPTFCGLYRIYAESGS